MKGVDARWLVTGASGFIGRNVLLRAPRDWDIVAVYHDAADFPSFLEREQLGQRPRGPLRSGERRPM